MQELVICRGIPASGKSTFSQSWVLAGKDRVRVCRDDIRIACLGSYSDVDEDLVSKIEESMIIAALKAGKSVIVDSTNVRQKYVNRYAFMALERGISVSIEEFPISLNEALARNAARERKVPVEVIERMHGDIQKQVTLPEFKIVPYSPPNTVKPRPGMTKYEQAVLVDIDGTLAKMGERGPYDWNKVDGDEVIEAIRNLLETLYVAGHPIILMSGRDESCRELTELWLEVNDIPYDELYMRPAGDMRRDSIIKHELFDKHVRDRYNVEWVLDDRNQVVNMWRSMGLTVLQVADGDF